MAQSFLAVALADMATYTFPLDICFHFIMHLVRASSSFHLYHYMHYINTCCRCYLQSAAENATNTRVPSSPASVDAWKVLGRVVSANARNSQDSTIKVLKAIYLKPFI